MESCLDALWVISPTAQFPPPSLPADCPANVARTNITPPTDKTWYPRSQRSGSGPEIRNRVHGLYESRTRLSAQPGGRPDGFGWRHFAATSLRCQRNSAPGATIDGFGFARCRIATSCRSTSISGSLEALERTSRASQPGQHVKSSWYTRRTATKRDHARSGAAAQPARPIFRPAQAKHQAHATTTTRHNCGGPACTMTRSRTGTVVPVGFGRNVLLQQWIRLRFEKSYDHMPSECGQSRRSA